MEKNIKMNIFISTQLGKKEKSLSNSFFLDKSFSENFSEKISSKKVICSVSLLEKKLNIHIEKDILKNIDPERAYETSKILVNYLLEMGFTMNKSFESVVLLNILLVNFANFNSEMFCLVNSQLFDGEEQATIAKIVVTNLFNIPS